MASDRELAEYIVESLSDLGETDCRKMFGEYCIYLNSKPVGFLCDNMLLVKTNAEMRAMKPDVPQQLLFEGAVNPMWVIEDPDDRATVHELFGLALRMLPDPKAKSGNPTNASVKSKTRRKKRDGEGSPWSDPEAMRKSR